MPADVLQAYQQIIMQELDSADRKGVVKLSPNKGQTIYLSRNSTVCSISRKRDVGINFMSARIFDLRTRCI